VARKEGGDSGKMRSVLEGLVVQTGDVERVRRECLNLLLAGHATVGISLSELFWYLARYPDVWRKLREEAFRLQGRPPTFAELKGFTYLKWAINEGMFVSSSSPSFSVTFETKANRLIIQ
jgi:cytochrome P450